MKIKLDYNKPDHEGQEVSLAYTQVSLAIRFISANGVVTDTKTGLMWAAHDNGKSIIWLNAKAHCDNYKGGGYTDWRLPTQDEPAELYKTGSHNFLHEGPI